MAKQLLSPGRTLALGFLTVILIGSGLLMLPCSIQAGQQIRYIDALYTATSAVCVTGLVTLDPGTALTPLGRCFLALLIQIGGLGVATVGAGVVLALGKKIRLKDRTLIQTASNLYSGKGTIRFVKQVLRMTLTIELLGAGLCFPIFVQDYPPLSALGYSLFHSVSAFNNAGFDILGHSGSLTANTSLIAYHDNLPLNLVTIGLILVGGIGFLVLQELRVHRLHWKHYSMHSKVVLSVSAVLVISGMLLLRLTAPTESWLSAGFHSVSARTAGFSTIDIAAMSDAGLLGLLLLMFIGASPGSTGGGIKTTSLFVLVQGIRSAASNRSEKAFHYAIPPALFRKAAVIAALALSAILSASFLLLLLEPDIALRDALFEMTSAFGTVGLSTGITPHLGIDAKLLSMLMMYIGRLGSLTIASLWSFRHTEHVNYPDGNLAVG